MTSQLDILAEAISGWHDQSPQAVARRERARRRAWAIRNGKPWQIDHLAAEIEHLWGTDSAVNIARRLHYGTAASLVRRLYNNGYRRLASKLENALLREGAVRSRDGAA
jgi:hypothetical protein